jgi:hypothetical protein
LLTADHSPPLLANSRAFAKARTVVRAERIERQRVLR